MQVKKKIIVSVTNDLVVDQRVHKICIFLCENNFEVTLVGRKLNTSSAINRLYQTKRFKLMFQKGPLFYINYSIRLFFYLLFKKTDILLANDLDTLLPNYLVSKIRKKELIYDTHEYFTEVPELIDRPKIKKIWTKIEKYIFPKLTKVYTVNNSIAKIYSEKYHVKVKTVRNVPNYSPTVYIEKNTTPTVFYQGALNKDRGLEELIDAFQFLEDIQLEIAGSGDVESEIKDLVERLKLSKKVKFLGKIPFEELRNYTLKATLGVTLEKDTNLNYRYALPNKLFDYISCNIPVLTCALPEIKNIVDQYKVGETLETISGELIADKIKEMIANKDKMNYWVQNTILAAKELCWENEIKTLKEIYSIK